MAAGPGAVPAADQRRWRRARSRAVRRRPRPARAPARGQRSTAPPWCNAAGPAPPTAADARPTSGYLLHSAPFTWHWTLVRFWQPWIAASSAAARVGRVEPPQILPSSVTAMAPHCFGVTRKTTLQPVVLQFLIATSSACFWFASFQLKPYLPVASSRAKAPYSAKAGAAFASMKTAAANPAALRIARRILSVLLRALLEPVS